MAWTAWARGGYAHGRAPFKSRDARDARSGDGERRPGAPVAARWPPRRPACAPARAARATEAACASSGGAAVGPAVLSARCPGRRRLVPPGGSPAKDRWYDAPRSRGRRRGRRAPAGRTGERRPHLVRLASACRTSTAAPRSHGEPAPDDDSIRLVPRYALIIPGEGKAQPGRRRSRVPPAQDLPFDASSPSHRDDPACISRAPHGDAARPRLRAGPGRADRRRVDGADGSLGARDERRRPRDDRRGRDEPARDHVRCEHHGPGRFCEGHVAFALEVAGPGWSLAGDVDAGCCRAFHDNNSL